jgi:hypothetical protein
MTSFVHLEYSRQHPGVQRLESAVSAAHQIRRSFRGTRGLASLLLSAVAAAGMVVAYQVMDTVAEGHLMVIWIAMWAAAFSVLALFAGTARQLAMRTRAGMDAWSASLAQSSADARMMSLARTDPRVMADLKNAQTRFEAYQPSGSGRPSGGPRESGTSGPANADVSAWTAGLRGL